MSDAWQNTLLCIADVITIVKTATIVITSTLRQCQINELSLPAKQKNFIYANIFAITRASHIWKGVEYFIRGFWQIS